MPSLLQRPVVLLAAASLAFAAHADRRDTSPLGPLLELTLVGRELIAIDGEVGGQRALRLELGEQFLYDTTQGRVGVAVTDRRILATATRSGTWQEARYRDGEAPPPPAAVELGDRVALTVLAKRVVGFDGASRNLIENSLGPREKVLATSVGLNVAAVATDRRGLALSAQRGGFFEVRLRLGEELRSLEAFANHVTLTTSQRLLVFRGPTASWEERRLPLR